MRTDIFSDRLYTVSGPQSHTTGIRPRVLWVTDQEEEGEGPYEDEDYYKEDDDEEEAEEEAEDARGEEEGG